MTRTTRRGLLGFALAAAAVGAVGYATSRPRPVAVETVAVERGPVERTVTNSRAGTVEARRRARLSPEAGGRVVALPHREGDLVAEGDVLIELDSTLERGEVALRERESAAARAEAERACLAAERAERELERTRQLAAEELVAADALDRVETAAREAEAGCAAARAAAESAAAAVDLARRALGKRTLAAPFDGVVAELTIEVGEWTTPSPPALPVPPVVDLLDPDSLFVELPMDEVDAALLAVGLPARVSVDSHPGRSFAGRVVHVAPYVLDLEAQNRTVAIEVELAERPEPPLLPGTSADAELIVERREAALRLPAGALLAGDRVLAVEGGTLVERKLGIGLRNWQFVEVLSGLEEGDLVVAAHDREEIRAGARVAGARANG
jgi:HlyD family secretion protein